jgi:adenosylcobinamide-GDP ribazoletransferase
VSGLRAATSFLTRVRVPPTDSGPNDLARAARWFPVVGGLLGLGLAGVYGSARLGLPAFVAATVSVGFGLLITGALHEDGLGDTADALGGGWNRDEALRILKDPAMGTFGVLAIGMSVLLRVGALSTLDGWSAAAILPGAHALSRAISVALLAWLPAAADGGLGASYATSMTGRRALGTVGVALLVGAASLGVWVLPGAVLAGLGGWGVGRLAVRKIDGVTGDILGAVQQTGEVLVLLLGAVVVGNGWPYLPWWR